MKKHLEKLRNKSDDHKKNVAQTSAIIVTVLIVIVWLLLKSLIPQTETTSQEDPSFFSGFNTLIDSGLKTFGTIQDDFKENPLDPLIEAMEEESEAEVETTTEVDTGINENSETEKYGTEQ